MNRRVTGDTEMTEAQKLVEEFRTITAPGAMQNTWKWAKRVTRALEPMGKSTIGQPKGRGVASIQVFRCADGSRFAYDMNGASQTWAMPSD
jgi:hypothetical protein